MHSRNIFKNGLDFKYLCKTYPVLCQYTNVDISTGRYYFVFSNMRALQELCRITLLEYFHLDMIMIENRLIPRIPMRLNYILWVEDLLDICRINIENLNTTTYWGMDVGCGPYSLFSAMFSKAKPDWNFICTDIDEENVKNAQDNIQRNNLLSQIRIEQETDIYFTRFFQCMNEIIDRTDNLPPRTTTVIFTMCNPPFFDNSDREISIRPFLSDSAIVSNKKSNSSSISKMKQNLFSKSFEISCSGGEVEFLQIFITKSLVYLNQNLDKKHIKIIFTSMLGKKSNLRKLKNFIRSHGHHIQIEKQTFSQGKTNRWGIAWFLKQ